MRNILKTTKALNKIINQKKSVIIIGADLSTNGGIASVIKYLYFQHEKENNDFDIKLLKTTNYKDSTKLKNLLIFFSSIIKYPGLLLANKKSIVHVHSSSGNSFYRKCFFWAGAKLFKLPIIMHLHASQFDKFFIDNNFLKTLLIKLILKRSNLVIVLCENWKNMLKKRYDIDNVVVLHNPITDLNERNSFSLAGPLNILFVGFFIESKGIKDLLTVAIDLKNRNVDFRLNIAGKGELSQHIVDKINSHNLGDFVNLVGWADTEKKYALYKQADVLFLPSYNEGMPMVILEALSFGLPIISTNIAGIPDTVLEGKNGFLLSPGDIDGFVEKLGYLACNRNKLNELSINSYSHAKSFLAVSIYSKLKKYYQSLFNLI